MTVVDFIDHRLDPAAWANHLGISRHAVDLYLDSEVIDLHLDSFIWHRIFGYDLRKRHGSGLFGGSFYSQIDFPRILEANLTGATWVITTNPLRTARGRRDAFVKNIARIRALFDSAPEHFQLVRNAAEYQRARGQHKHAAFLGIQGGNALDFDLDSLDLIPDDSILRITLVHLNSSRIGTTSSPLNFGGSSLTNFGREYVRRLNEKKIFVDLAHISRPGFFAAAEVHDKAQPLLVTHTGVCGVHKHWRNLTDEQLHVIADTGGTIGVMYQSSFLGDPIFHGRADSVVAHIDHIVRTVGDDHVSLGSDWDGAITPPRDLRSCTDLPRIVQIMLDDGYREERIRKILGLNFLRVVEQLRG